MGMRVGLLGGSFDPVHYGHLRAAECALELFDLTEVRLMPARQSPFKRPCVAPQGARLDMLQLAVQGNSRIGIEACELERAAPSFTVDTLQSLTRSEPGARFTLILGSDAARGLDGWREIATIRSLAEVRVLGRPGETPTPGDGVVAFDGLDISSSCLRRAVKTGRSIRYLTPESVCGYIEEKGLYK